MLASARRRRGVIAAEIEQMRSDVAHWNTLHPDDEPLDAGDLDEILEGADAAITVLEERVREMSGGK